MRNASLSVAIVSLLSFAFCAVTSAAIVDPNRYVQMTTIDLNAGVIEIVNLDSVGKDLTGWRFCTHDEDQVRQYSAAAGLNGINLAAGDSLFIHFLNDASGAANELNISDIGGNFALPFDAGPAPGGAYGIGLYANSGFGNGDNLADHIQFSFNGDDNDSADDRSDEAEGEVWLDQNDWVSVDLTTTQIVLNAAFFDDEIHSSASYTVVPEPGSAMFLMVGMGLVAARRRRQS